MSAVEGALSLRLLGGFELKDRAGRLEVSARGRRLIAFLALHGRPLSRSFVSGSLWPETSDAKAAANLRTTLWRLHDLRRPVVSATPTTLALADSLSVDTRRLEALGSALASDGLLVEAALIDPTTLAGELLPELWDPWLVFERERLRQVSLHTLETLSRHLSARGLHAAAVLAGLAAVEAEPLRETANRALVEAHLAEGNLVEAVRHYRRFAELLRRELGVQPQPEFLAALSELHVQA